MENSTIKSAVQRVHGEEWRTIKAFPNYKVSNLGRVKSERTSNTKILKQHPNHKGYLCVCLTDKDGKSKTQKVHKLVAQEFLNHIPCGMKEVVNHKNNNRQCNNVNNLELVTNQENSRQHRDSVGVSWYEPTGKWIVQCMYPSSGIKYNLGYYTDKFEAQYVSDLAYELICDGLSIQEWMDYLNQEGVTSRKRPLKIK